LSTVTKQLEPSLNADPLRSASLDSQAPTQTNNNGFTCVYSPFEKA